MTKNAIVIIPARGGSKRIPRKNLKLFHGKPIIEYSIRASTQSGVVQDVIISTDDEEISSVSKSLGARVPFLREANLADDHSGTTEVVIDAINRLSLDDEQIVICLYATAPLLRAEDLSEAVEKFQNNDCEFVFAAGEFSPAPQRALKYQADGFLAPVDDDSVLTRSQDLSTQYFDAGQFYIASAASWRAGKHPYLTKALPHILPKIRICDIDTPEDWDFAEFLYSYNQSKSAL